MAAAAERPRSSLTVLSLGAGLASVVGMLMYAGSGAKDLLAISLVASGVTLLAALIALGKLAIGGFRCRGLGMALTAGCLALVSPVLSIGFG